MNAFELLIWLACVVHRPRHQRDEPRYWFLVWRADRPRDGDQIQHPFFAAAGRTPARRRSAVAGANKWIWLGALCSSLFFYRTPSGSFGTISRSSN